MRCRQQFCWRLFAWTLFLGRLCGVFPCVVPIKLGMILQSGNAVRGVRGGKEQPGEFRSTQNFIKGRGLNIRDARYVPPPVSELPQALGSLEQYINQEQARERDPLLVQIALIQYQFEAFHPFRDGNGRLGRLFQKPSITIRQAADFLEISPQAAAYNIRRLTSEDILREITGKARNQVFVAEEILRFLYETSSD